jgi:hypothetical protein
LFGSQPATKFTYEVKLGTKCFQGLQEGLQFKSMTAHLKVFTSGAAEYVKLMGFGADLSQHQNKHFIIKEGAPAGSFLMH